jgi:hypothetical protein
MSHQRPRHFLFFMRPRDSHSYVTIARGMTPLEAITRHILAEDSSVSVDPSGNFVMQYGRRTIVYAHALAYVEAVHKTQGEWQMRQLPEWTWEADYAPEVFTGEHPDEVASAVEACRSALHQDYPRARPRSFVWYLRGGPLVTFYRPNGPFQIEVLRRYAVDWSSGVRTSEWAGGYEKLLDELLLEVELR